MSRYANFEIRVLDQQLHSTQPPEDALGELTPLEMGLWWFCFDCNRPVQLSIGPITEHLELDTDFSLLLPHRLPRAVGELLRGKNVHLHFAEAQLKLGLTPRGDIVDAVVETYGYHVSSTALTLRASAVVETLRTFLMDLINRAVEGGYISATDGSEALKPILSSDLGDAYSR